MLPKVELHVHLEGTMLPRLAKRIAEKNHIALPLQINVEDSFYPWQGLEGFLKIYDIASYVLRTEEDYRDLTYEYLVSVATEGTLYVEIILTPDHAAMCGLSYQEYLSGVAQGIDDARHDFGIESRLQIMCVRNFGVESCIRVAQQVAQNTHPYVVGFTMGGNEQAFKASDFTQVYQIAANAGLGCSIHAGEMAGAQSVWDAINHLPLQRIGHGVRAIEDSALLAEIKKRNITLEVCPSSNIAFGIYPDYQQHPFRQLYEYGIAVTLNTDDPPYFKTSLSNEYKIAQTYWGFTDNDLQKITRQAIQASFAEEKLKMQILSRL